MTTELADAALVDLVADRDLDAFGVLYDRHAARVYGLACRVLVDRSAAQDVAQEVFAVLWAHPEYYDPHRASLLGWLLSITHHKAVDAVRKSTVRTAAPLDLVAEMPTPREADPAETALRTAEAERVRQACLGLPREQREALGLTYWAGHTQAEIAEITGVPVGTVKWRVHAAVQRLRLILGGGRG